MGRNTKSKKKRQKKAVNNGAGDPEASPSNGPSTTGNRPKYTIDQLLEKASDAIDTFNYEIAQKFCQRALEMDSDNLKALEMSGQLLLDLGNPEASKHCFGRAVELSPESGHSKYMYLGQLFQGEEAIRCFQKGVDLMIQKREEEAQLATAGATSQSSTVSERDISNAHCSIAELYMTDCCSRFSDLPEAESRCLERIQQACTADTTNPEALQLYASFLLVKQDVEAAKEKIQQSVSLWLPRARLLDQPEAKDLAEMGEEPDELNPVKLGYPTRVQAAQILVEVKEYDTACEVLEGLLDENDEVVEVWHLLGWVHYQQGPDYYNNARHYLSKAKQVMTKTGDDDTEMKTHIDDLLTKLGPGPCEDPDEVMEGEQQDDVDEEADSSDDDQNMES